MDTTLDRGAVQASAPVFRPPPRRVQDLLERTAESAPSLTALASGGLRLTYGELEARANGLAWRFVERGVRRGDRVLVLAENGPEAVVAFWAALKADAVVSVVHPQTRPEKLRFLLGDAEPAALVTHAALAGTWAAAAAAAPSLRAVFCTGEGAPTPGTCPVAAWSVQDPAACADAPPPARALDVDLAAILYTSGSTGEPKGVMLTHRNVLAAASSILEYLGTTREDVIYSVLPLSFDYGLYQAIMACATGARLVLDRGLIYPAVGLQRIADERATVFPLVPTIAAMVGAVGPAPDVDLSSVRTVTSTAAALAPQRIAELRALFPRARVFSMYGLIECKRCTYVPPEELDRKPGSVGLPIPNTEVWTVDEHGRRLGPGEVGQLVVRGAHVMQGYWRRPEDTAARLRPGPVPGERVLYTGDLCSIDEEGYVWFVERMDRVFKSRGEKVAPREVELALLAIPGVREAAVCGVPDEVLGAAIKAFVVRDEGEAGAALDGRAVLRGCQERLEPTLVPRYVAFVPNLPRTPTGKVDARSLLELHPSGDGPRTETAP